MAKWPSGKAEACKAFTPGSNPGVASIFFGAIEKGICGHGSAGRASPCQGEGRGFESRCPLHYTYATEISVAFLFVVKQTNVRGMILFN